VSEFTILVSDIPSLEGFLSYPFFMSLFLISFFLWFLFRLSSFWSSTFLSCQEILELWVVVVVWWEFWQLISLYSRIRPITAYRN